MLPIAGFDILDNDELIELDIVIDAIKLIEPIKINRDIVFLIENIPFRNFKGDIFSDDCPDFIIELIPNLFERMVNKALGLESEPIKISKEHALKLLELSRKKEILNNIGAIKQTTESGADKIKIPESEREGKAYLFIKACFYRYKSKPESLDQLIQYCKENGVEGYTDIKIDGTDKRSRKVKCNEHKEGITWASLMKVYKQFIEKQD